MAGIYGDAPDRSRTCDLVLRRNRTHFGCLRKPSVYQGFRVFAFDHIRFISAPFKGVCYKVCYNGRAPRGAPGSVWLLLAIVPLHGRTSCQSRGAAALSAARRSSYSLGSIPVEPSSPAAFV